MGDSRIGSMALGIEPPRQGALASLAANGTTAFADLESQVSGEKIWRNRFITLQADGADVYVALTQANASPANDLDPTANGSLSAPGTAACLRIPDGQQQTLLIDGENSPWRYLAYRCRTGSTAQLRVWPSSKKELPR